MLRYMSFCVGRNVTSQHIIARDKFVQQLDESGKQVLTDFLRNDGSTRGLGDLVRSRNLPRQ